MVTTAIALIRFIEMRMATPFRIPLAPASGTPPGQGVPSARLRSHRKSSGPSSNSHADDRGWSDQLVSSVSLVAR
jgi:hypothetical protein